MFSKKCRFLRPAGATRFLVGVVALLALAAPGLAQQGPFAPGDFCTYTQGGWGAVPHGNNPGTILENNFSTVFGGFVEVGLPGSAGYSMQFTSPVAIRDYLPAGSKPKPLDMDYTNPTATKSGVFGGQVLALQLNVDFDPAFGGLVISGTGTSFDTMTVAQLLDAANQALGTPTPSLPANLNDIVAFLNQGFDNCLPSGWAQQYLTPPSGGGDPPPPA